MAPGSSCIKLCNDVLMMTNRGEESKCNPPTGNAQLRAAYCKDELGKGRCGMVLSQRVRSSYAEVTGP